MPASIRANLQALALGAAGGATFASLGLPLPWLLGALITTLVATTAGVKLTLDTRIRDTALTVLGVTIGTALTPDLVERARDWWPSLIGIALYVAIAAPLGILYCRRVMGFDSTSATFAGTPGGLAEMVLTGTTLGGDTRRIALTHAGRLTVILVLTAPAMQYLTGLDVSGVRPRFSPWESPPPTDALALLCCALLGAVIGRLLRLPNPFLLGPLIVTATVQLTGLTITSPPNWLLDMVQLSVGVYVGTQFTDTRFGKMLRTLALSTLLTFTLLGLAGLFAWLISQYGGLPFAAVLLAFIPGGIAEMCLIAIILNVDPIFVAAHQIFRVLLIMGSSPLLASWVRLRADSD